MQGAFALRGIVEGLFGGCIKNKETEKNYIYCGRGCNPPSYNGTLDATDTCCKAHDDALRWATGVRDMAKRRACPAHKALIKCLRHLPTTVKVGV